MERIWKKRLLAGMFVLVLGCLLFTGCGNKPTAAPPAVPEKYSLTDQKGRQVEIPVQVNRIVCLQHHTLDILLELGAQDKLVGVLADWKGLLGDYAERVDPKLKNLPTPGNLKTANVEAVAALKPDVVFVSNQMDQGVMDKLQGMGIPVVVVTLYDADKLQASTIHPDLKDPDKAYTDGLHWAVENIGRIVGKTDRAAQLWKFVEDNRKVVTDTLAAVPEDKRIRVYMANEKMYTYGTGKYVGAAMQRAGAKNVAETLKGYVQVNVEQVAQWNPSVIFVQNRYSSVLDEIRSNPSWAEIDAVRNNRLIMAPEYVKPWGNPTPESMALGELWLAKTLYPDVVAKVDLEARVQEFYRTFYGVPYEK